MSLLNKILDFLGLHGSQERRQLREVSRYLKNNKSGFVKVRKNTLQPSMAKFFYTIYYFSCSFKSLIERMRKSEMIFSVIFEECLKQNQREWFNFINSRNLEERSKSLSIEQLRQEAYTAYNNLTSDLKSQDLKRINETYSLFKVFEDLVTFDYFPILRLFDPMLPENDFRYTPRFNSINGSEAIPFLKNFSEVLNTISFVPHWEQVFNTIKVYNRGQDPVKPSVWQKVIRDLANLKKSGLIEAIVRSFEDSIRFSPRSVLRVENLAPKYLEGCKDSIESFFYRLQQEREKKEITRIISLIFTPADHARILAHKMRNYSEEISSKIYSKVSMGYKYSTALLYLRAFTIECLKTEFRDVVNTLVVKGQWRTSQFSRDLSDGLHSCMIFSEDIAKFDDILNESAPYGKRILVLIHRVSKDRSAAEMLKQTLEDVNSKAYQLLKKADRQLINLSSLFKEVSDDYSKDINSRELLLNWRELENESHINSDKPLGQAFNEVCEKLNFFIEFLSLYLS